MRRRHSGKLLSTMAIWMVSLANITRVSVSKILRVSQASDSLTRGTCHVETSSRKTNQRTVNFREPGPRTCTSRCYNRSLGRRDKPPLGEGNIDQSQAADSCTLLTTDSNPHKRREIYPCKVGSPTARHDASNLEPTVQGSWPRELRFYRNRNENRRNRVIKRSHLLGSFEKPDWTHTQS